MSLVMNDATTDAVASALRPQRRRASRSSSSSSIARGSSSSASASSSSSLGAAATASRKSTRRDMYELEVQRANGLPITVTCKSNSTNSTTSSDSDSNSTDGTTNTNTTGVRRLRDATIAYAYEFAIIDPREENLAEVFQQDVPALQFFILYYVAAETGVLQCDLNSQMIPLFGSNHSSLSSPPTTTTSANQTRNDTRVDLISLSSVSTNAQDMTVGGSCKYLVDLEPGLVCLPLNGTMSATFVGSDGDRAAVEAFLAYHIEKVINSSKIREGNVKDAIFLGTRVLPEPTPVGQQQQPPSDTPGGGGGASILGGTRDTSSDNNNGSVAALASSLSVAAVVTMLVLYLAVARRRGRKQQSERLAVQSASGRGDKQVLVVNSSRGGKGDGPQPEVIAAATTRSLESKSGDFNEEGSDNACCGIDIESPVLGRDDQEVPSSPPPQVHRDSNNNNIINMTSVYSFATALTAASTAENTDESQQASLLGDEGSDKAANDVSIEITDDVELARATPPPPTVIDILPPKPPTGPSAKKLTVPPVAGGSKPLKQRRRRKKKKKATMVRSNSRENINEMETITEGEEDASNDKDDEDGSEYSWCSTSDSDPGSNPGSRDPSPARSREASPARSTGSGSDGNFAANNMSGGSWENSGTSIGLPAATSSDSDGGGGGGRTKANRLPPKWI